MKVLADTSVWSLALRRRKPAANPYVDELRELTVELRLEIVGSIRQEVLSGIRELAHYESLRDHLRAFVDLPLEPEDYEMAARFFNRCRQGGVQGSNTDFLICSVAHRRSIAILTTDPDFERFASLIPVVLHEPRG